MNDEDISTTYDTVQKETMYEALDQPEENEGPLYHNIHEDRSSGNNLYATDLETHEYESVSVDAVGGEENSLAFSQSEEEGYPQPYAICPAAQDPQPDEPQEVGNVSMEELYSPIQYQETSPEEPQENRSELYSPIQDQEMSPEEPQENRSMMEGSLPSPSSFTVQKASEYSLTCYSAANDLEEEEESAPMNPEISLFVKVRLPLSGASALAGGRIDASFCSE
ncbi:unnamed protein product [Pipistrellus nathusii]|uniref:Uncharacterized protein n=1 Tax=Pipistrellus nathusii TaxID=59473 RepID=A0ABP0A8S6_PIPNA